MSELLQALYEGRRDDAAALLEADPSPVLDIFEAAAVSDGALVADLLRADGSLATAWTDDGFTALHLACFFGTSDVVLALVDAGADLNVASRNPMGVRPINSAAAGDQALDSVRVLLDHGADVDGRQTSGHTALDEAHIREDHELIALLVDRGATT